MKMKKIMTILAVTLGFSMSLTACGFGKKDPVVVEDSQEADKEGETDVEVGPTDAPEMTPAPDLQVSNYTSSDGKIRVSLPDATWAVESDGEKRYSFKSPKQGTLEIMHGKEDDLASQIIPKDQNTAETLEKGTAGTDYEIQNYIGAEENGNGIYTYTVKMLKDDSDYNYVLYKYLANAGEFFIVTGRVVGEDAASIERIQTAMDSFAILDETSSLKDLAKPAPIEENTSGETAEGTPEQETPEEAPAEAPAAEEPAPEQPSASGGIAPSRDNPDNSDNSKTRTIYTNDGAGRAFVVTLNPDGVWVDAQGNQYRFQNESDVYDQNDVDYYYHGEAADVYYMPVE